MKLKNHLDQCIGKLNRAIENFKNNNQWLVEGYWEWYYKMNDMYKKIMSYPEVQQIKAIVKEMIETVSIPHLCEKIVLIW